MSPLHTVFVSHSHADNALCDQYVAALRAYGLDVWYDRNDAQQGRVLSDELQQQLRRRSALVVLMTPNAADSFWVNLEVNAYLALMAQDASRLLLVVKIAPCVMPLLFNAFLWMDAGALGFDATVEAMTRALGASPPALEHAPTAPGRLAPTAPPAARNAAALRLTPKRLYDLGFEGRIINGVEVVLPPLNLAPAGPFTMGSDPARDPDAYDDETPQYLVETAVFQIARFSVTVAEYTCAVRAGAVREPPTVGGVSWKTQLRRLDHPVVCLSWDDATAYAAWPAQVTSQPWRLPTEAEWEKAARGTDERIFPWGDQFDKTCCNTSESRVGAPSHVGTYPSGASPLGAHDMCGNVWDWCSSRFEPYPYRMRDDHAATAPNEHRVLRGGSWKVARKNARVACRLESRPSDFKDDWGCRLALTTSGSAPGS